MRIAMALAMCVILRWKIAVSAAIAIATGAMIAAVRS
jgi:hypothetical protein